MAEQRTAERERIGRLIAELRDHRGLTQQDLANESDVQVGTVSRIERGLHTPTVKNVRKLAKVLRVPPATLLPAEPELDSQLQRIDGKLAEMVRRLEAIERRLGAGPDLPAAEVRAAVDVAGRLAETDESQTPQAPEQPETRKEGKRRKNA